MSGRPSLWPLPVAAIIFAIVILAAFLFAAPGLFFAAWVPAMWFCAHLWHCFAWGARHGDIEGAFR